MKKLILFLSFISFASFGQVKISDQPVASDLTGTTYVPIIKQSGSVWTNYRAASTLFTSGGIWGNITGTLSSQTDLNTALGLKAPLASPTFTGTVTLPATILTNALSGTGNYLPITLFNSGTSASASTFWRGDGTWGSVSASPGGSTTQIQFNLTGAFAGNSNFTINNSTGVVTFGVTPIVPNATAGSNDTGAANHAYVDALTALTSGNIVVGNSSNVATGVSLTGDGSITNAGVLKVTGLNGHALPSPAAGTLTSDVSGNLSWSGGGGFLALAGTSTLTNDVTYAGGFKVDWTNSRTQWTSTYTAGANGDHMYGFLGRITARATINDTVKMVEIVPRFTTGQTGQLLVGLFIDKAKVATTGGAAGATYLFQTHGANGDVWINSTGALSTTRGLSFQAGNSGGANTIDFASGTGAQLVSSSGSGNQLSFVGGTSTQASGANVRFKASHTWAPVSGATSMNLFQFQHTVNETGTSTGVAGGIDVQLVPTAMIGNYTFQTFTSSSGITLANTLTGIDYNPSITSVTTHYAALFRLGFVGIGNATPTYQVDIKGTAANQNLLTVAEDGGTKVLEIKESGGVRQMGWFGVTPVGQQSVNTILVNNVTSGGTLSTIANYTDLTIYANDAAAIRNNFFRLTEKVLKLETALRNLGASVD